MAEDLSEVTAKTLESSDAQTKIQIDLINMLKVWRSKSEGNSLADKEMRAESIARTELLIEQNQKILEELQTISDNTEKNEIDAAFGNFKGLGLLLTGLGIAIGGVIGTIAGVMKAMGTVIKAFTPKWINTEWRRLTRFLKIKFGAFKLSFAQTLKSGLDFVSGKFKGVTDILTKWAKKFPKIGNVLKTLSQPFVALKDMMKGSTKAISGITKVAEKGKSIFGGLKSFGLGIGNVARVVSKIAAPLTIIMGAFDAVTGAMEGWETGGVLGAIGGAIKGLVNSIIMKPLDLLKDGVSWILEKMGFADASKALDSFSFEDMFTKLIDFLVGGIQNVWDTFSDSMSNIGHTISEAFKEIVRAFLPAEGSFGANFVPDSVYEWAKAAPPKPIDMESDDNAQGEAGNAQLEKQKKRRATFTAIEPEIENEELARQARQRAAFGMVKQDPVQVAKKMEVVKQQKELTENESEVKMQGGQDRSVVVAPNTNNVNNVSNVTHNSVPPKARPEWNSDLRRSWA